MKITVNPFDIRKLDKLMEDNEFVRMVLEPVDGYWFVETENNDQLRELKRLLNSKRIRYTIHR